MATEMHGELAIDATQQREPAEAAAAARSERVMLLVGLSAAGGVIHAKALFDHASHYWLFGVFFGVLTYAQVLWAMQVYRRPDDRRWFRTVAAGNLVVVGIWLVSRTVGLPFGPWAGEAEPLALNDMTASAIELLLTALIVAMLYPGGRFARRMRWLDGPNCTRIGTMLVALSLLAVLFGKHTHPGTG
jgi:hypothetical protein